MQTLKAWWQRFSAGYARFVEREGFLVILVSCIGVIAATAIWTARTEPPVAMPTPPVDQVALAARLQQESLASVATPRPSPAPTIAPWRAPLGSWAELTPFSASRLTPSGVTGLWRLHDAVDLACETGEPIVAMRDGTVLSVTDKGLTGAGVIIDHGDGVTAEYAGMALHSGLRPGDPVSAGQTVGFGGNTVVDETDLGPHLHLRVTQGGQAVDPRKLVKP